MLDLLLLPFLASTLIFFCVVTSTRRKIAKVIRNDYFKVSKFDPAKDGNFQNQIWMMPLEFFSELEITIYDELPPVDPRNTSITDQNCLYLGNTDAGNSHQWYLKENQVNTYSYNLHEVENLETSSCLESSPNR